MTEKFGTKITLVVVLVVAACASLLVPEKPFRLGLDLQGGTRLQYQFDFQSALLKGQISQQEFDDKGTLLENFCLIIRNRVDPNGVMELSIRPVGTDRVVIELPGAAELSSKRTSAKLADPLTPTADTLTLAATDPEVIKEFPSSGGVVSVGREHISYTARTAAALTGLRRGAEKTDVAAHDAGAPVELLTNDDLQKRIENVGDMHFYIGAKPGDISAMGSDLTSENKKVVDWIKAHPLESLDNFAALAPEAGGPLPGLRWYPMRIAKGSPETPVESRLQPLLTPPEKWIFSGDDLETVTAHSDELGYPAVSFEMAATKKTAFGDFTEAHISEGMAIVLNGEIVTLATINSKLPGSGIISGGAGGFTQHEVNDLVTVLRSGSLRIKPTLQNKERVGASLGEDYVWSSFLSSIIAFGVVATFMIGFYRKLGVFSVIALLINLLLLMGTLAFLRATLTLPGVAGIILTLGMAVDGNILIYERLREEMQRGQKLIQSAKASFERAAVTIIDSNVTTLIAGVILYKFGTGPIRGFATTLNIGILTTLFTVIVVTQVLVFGAIKRGATHFHMMDVFKIPRIAFMDAAKYAIPVSVALMVASIALFAWLPNREKLGIDFLGGFTMTVRTQEPQSIDTMRAKVGAIPSTVGKSAEVKQILDSGSREAGYTAFRITYKVEDAAAGSATGSGETGEKEIRDALAGLLQRGPIEITTTPTDAGADVSGDVYFETPHPEADVIAALGRAGLTDVRIEPQPNRAHLLRIFGKLPKDKVDIDLVSAMTHQFEGRADSAGKPFALLSPVPESALVGPQVGSELRDKAIIAIILSMLGSILYVRVRFAEYSYGIAVVAALAHDVIITLGGLAVATWSGLLQAELDLSMIAAFLTIIGYSQNDTIVIFDRVRENLPRSKGTLKEVLNDSINQTLGRTIMTSVTVFLTLLVLFAFNVGTRNVLEGFSYAMLVGVISGCYSTIYIASPVLLWFERRAIARAAREQEQSSMAT